MLETVALVALAWIALLAGACVGLIVFARTTPVRLALLDLLVVMLVGTLGLLSVADGTAAYLDAAFALALLSFVATLAGARYHAEGRPL
jgi:multicomponent Na+:H+ antiporter subunit F